MLGPGTGALVDQLAILHHRQGGDAVYPELTGQLRFLVHIDLDDLNIFPLLSHLVQNGPFLQQLIYMLIHAYVI